MQATKAALLTEPYRIGLVDRQLECGDDEVIVKNHLMGICGSDKSFYRGQLPPKTAEFRQEPKFPFYLGHESGGEVVEVGRRVREFKPGDKVMAFGWNNNFAAYFKARVFELEPVPAGLDLDIASLGEPIACAMFSGLNSGVQLGDTVAVMGAGFAGQIIAQCAKKKGAERVIVIDVLDGKLQLAKKLGADIVINSAAADPVAAVQELTGGKGADVVVEAAGSEESINAATAMIRHNGIFVWYSWITRTVKLDISPLARRRHRIPQHLPCPPHLPGAPGLDPAGPTAVSPGAHRRQIADYRRILPPGHRQSIRVRGQRRRRRQSSSSAIIMAASGAPGILGF
jgi:L-iditol 2-dehydrogenase